MTGRRQLSYVTAIGVLAWLVSLALFLTALASAGSTAANAELQLAAIALAAGCVLTGAAAATGEAHRRVEEVNSRAQLTALGAALIPWLSRRDVTSAGTVTLALASLSPHAWQLLLAALDRQDGDRGQDAVCGTWKLLAPALLAGVDRAAGTTFTRVALH